MLPSRQYKRIIKEIDGSIITFTDVCTKDQEIGTIQNNIDFSRSFSRGNRFDGEFVHDYIFQLQSLLILDNVCIVNTPILTQSEFNSITNNLMLKHSSSNVFFFNELIEYAKTNYVFIYDVSTPYMDFNSTTIRAIIGKQF